MNNNIQNRKLKKKLIHALEAQISHSDKATDRIFTNALRANLHDQEFNLEEHMFNLTLQENDKDFKVKAPSINFLTDRPHFESANPYDRLKPEWKKPEKYINAKFRLYKAKFFPDLEEEHVYTSSYEPGQT